MKTKIRPLLKFCFLLAWGVVLVALPAIAQQQKLTNEDVVKMVKAGLSHQIIEQTVRSSDANFDLSTDGLIKLKNDGVPDSIVQAMIARSNTPNVTARTKPDGDCGISESDPLIVLDGSKRIELNYTTADTRVGLGAGALIGKGKGFATLKGAHAQTRLSTDALPVFEEIYIQTNQRPEDAAVLVKVEVKSDHREIEIAHTSLLSGTEGVPKNRIVPTFFEVVSSQPCTYQGRKFKQIRIKAQSSLQPGEYCLIVFGVYFFDFGVN